MSSMIEVAAWTGCAGIFGGVTVIFAATGAALRQAGFAVAVAGVLLVGACNLT